ncbi:ubiquitin-like-specific protease ESD4 [Phoenix dactylifera]|uniref:Ubiquitin-like-specific protease ESD4 n=1 Tax=Phoenix dactylifera TaxID=42345 RepID=A0A8B7CKH5_PHODC|nr:ubiquitin-like-specific protease ESD4 [Phoenix dactylifera]XP_038980503.1 ubiquitin-like-specific protease ESD4 [Phoenix dactylifera]
MGALTDHHKRCFVDLCLPFSPYSFFDSSSSPPSKKPKLQFVPSTPDRAPAPAPLPHNLPSSSLSSPLPRPLHGPQRILKAFGLGSARRAPPKWFGRTERSFDMGNFVSRLFQQKKEAWSSLSSRRKGEASVSENGSHKRLRLEQYKRLVVGSQEEHSGVVSDSTKVGLPRSFASAVSDLTIVTRKDEELSEPHVLSRKVEDARKVALEAIPVREERAWVKKGPLYKELYEEAKKHDSKLSRLELEVKLTVEKISRFRLFAAWREKPKEDLHELFTPLTDEEENEVSHALWGGSSHEVLVTHGASNIEITREVLQCLSSGAWLNDEVINVYLELLKERERREPGKCLKCHFFNTFFYKKLNSGRNGYDFKAVRRWTTQKKLGYGLIECDKIFVPVHKDIHWCLAVINVKNETFQYLDSLGGMDTVVLRVLATYFMDEVKDKSDKQIDTTSWKQESVDNLPLQKNGWDCGMFMLKYTDFYSRGLSVSFSQEHMEYFRKRTAKEILRLRAE